jgi:hypothetical protein
MVVEMEVSKILDEILPADGVSTEREQLRIRLHARICSLVWNAREELLDGMEEAKDHARLDERMSLG